jgi:hypothetical protein
MGGSYSGLFTYIKTNAVTLRVDTNGSFSGGALQTLGAANNISAFTCVSAGPSLHTT